MKSPFKGSHSPAVASGLKLVASGVSIRKAAKLAGCSFGGLAKAIARKRKADHFPAGFRPLNDD